MNRFTARRQVPGPTGVENGVSPSRGARAERGGTPAGEQNQPIRMLCVDDHAVLVEGLRAQFDIDGRIMVVGRLDSASGLVEAVDRTRAEAVLLDIEMPGPDAFEMADRLKRARPAIRIIVLSAHIRDGFISASFAAGISAYFAKSDEISDIVDGIVAATRATPDSFLLGPKVKAYSQPAGASRRALDGPRGARRRNESSDTALSTLTDRELEIVRLIGAGLSRVEIAAQLCRSAKTIDGHQARIMKKLGIDARADLIRFAIREGLAVV